MILGALYFYFIKNKDTNVITYTNVADSKNVDIVWTATGSGGYSFKYPENIGTKYISSTDWPPVLATVNTSFTCNEGGISKEDRAGKTTREIIEGKEFCITRISEGAAGSIYTNYTYTFKYNNKTMSISFSLRAPQCMNYDDPKQTECIKEENSFDISKIIARIIATIQPTN